MILHDKKLEVTSKINPAPDKTWPPSHSELLPVYFADFFVLFFFYFVFCFLFSSFW
jgi:hypothetical protein